MTAPGLTDAELSTGLALAALGVCVVVWGLGVAVALRHFWRMGAHAVKRSAARRRILR